jgi:hypothetical protein
MHLISVEHLIQSHTSNTLTYHNINLLLRIWNHKVVDVRCSSTQRAAQSAFLCAAQSERVLMDEHHSSNKVALTLNEINWNKQFQKSFRLKGQKWSLKRITVKPSATMDVLRGEIYDQEHSDIYCMFPSTRIFCNILQFPFSIDMSNFL